MLLADHLSLEYMLRQFGYIMIEFLPDNLHYRIHVCELLVYPNVHISSILLNHRELSLCMHLELVDRSVQRRHISVDVLIHALQSSL
jgi:hypothetical protein